MKSPISIVDVDRPESWTRYKAGMCDTCAANCCTMPVEVKMPDLIRLNLVSTFEAENEEEALLAYERLTDMQLKSRDLDGDSSWDRPWDVYEVTE